MPTLAAACQSWLLGLLLLFALLVLPAQHARAQAGTYGSNFNLQISPETSIVMVTALVGGISGVVFLVVDLALGARLPPFAAALELALAGLPLLTGGLFAFASPDNIADLGPPLALAGIGFTIHALDSLLMYESDAPVRTGAAPRALRLSVAPVLASHLIGGAVTARL